MKALKIIAIILAVICAVLVVEGIVFKTRKRLDYVACDDGFEYLDLNVQQVEWSKEQCRAEVEKMFGNPHYIYIERNCKYSHCIVALRIVVIRSGLGNVGYIHDLTHELVHLTEFVGNERYTEYRTFQRLYESNVAELHETGRRIAVQQYVGNESQPYQCWYYIKEYLKNESQ